MLTEDMRDVISVGMDGSFRVWDLEVGTCTVATKPSKPHGHLHLAGPDRILVASKHSPRAILMHPKGHGDMMRIDVGSPITVCLVHPKVRSNLWLKRSSVLDCAGKEAPSLLTLKPSLELGVEFSSGSAFPPPALPSLAHRLLPSFLCRTFAAPSC
jgi:hypothetical protein